MNEIEDDDDEEEAGKINNTKESRNEWRKWRTYRRSFESLSGHRRPLKGKNRHRGTLNEEERSMRQSGIKVQNRIEHLWDRPDVRFRGVQTTRAYKRNWQSEK